MIFPSFRVLIILSVTAGVFASPLGITYDKVAASPSEKANKERLDAATTDADGQVKDMRTALGKLGKPGDEKVKSYLEASFGKNYNLGKIDETVKALQTGNINAKVATHPFRGGEIAAVPWSQDKKTDPWIPGPARFGTKFHGGKDLDDAGTKMTAKGRAATVIHEATHQLKATGDEVHKETGQIIKADADNSKAHSIDDVSGYTSNPNVHTSVKEVNADKKFTDVRDKSTNMHDNAESYAIFASLCSQPGALSRRDARLFRRALLDADADDLHYLSRRQSCQLPPDYFKKKAEQKKAAAAAAAKTPAVKASTAAGKSSASLKAAPGSKLGSKDGVKATAATKGTKAKPATKGGIRPAVKGSKSSKATRPVGGTKGAAGLKASKGGVRTAQGLKAGKGAVASKGVKGTGPSAKGAVRPTVKGAKSSKAARPVRGAKSAISKGAKGVKASSKSGVRPVGKGTKAAAVKGTKVARPGAKTATKGGVRTAGKGKSAATKAGSKPLIKVKGPSKGSVGSASRGSKGASKAGVKAGSKPAVKGGLKAAAKGGVKATAKGGLKAAAKGGVKTTAKGGVKSAVKGGLKAAAQGGVKSAGTAKGASRPASKAAPKAAPKVVAARPAANVKAAPKAAAKTPVQAAAKAPVKAAAPVVAKPAAKAPVKGKK